MNLQCKTCGEQIEVPEEVLSEEQPRVTCPSCSARFRLRPLRDTTQPDPVATETEAPRAADSPTRPIFEPGQVVADRYRVIRFLAQGGMGEVYEAEDVELLQEVALKTISPRMGEESGVLDRFKREIALARTVTHPNVCRIFDLGSHRAGDQPVNFLTMELLRGETLSEMLRRRHRLSTSEALPLIEQMCAGLDAAHRARVVHRDLKSENVFLENASEGSDLAGSRVVLTDFGVARGTDAGDRFASQVTGLGIVGTPAYMAPEQVENKVITAKADIYSLGIVIYEMVTGCLPFEAESPLTTAVQRLRQAPPPPHVHVPDLPAWWERAILRCLERRPDDRFPDVMAVAQALHKPTRSTLVHSPQGDRRTGSGGSTSAQDHSRATSVGTAQARPSSGSPVGSSTASPTADGTGDDTSNNLTDGTLHGGFVMGTEKGRIGPLGRKLSWFLVALALLAGGLGGFLWLSAGKERDPSRIKLRRSVAVVGFENASGRAEADWLSVALGEMVTQELSKSATLRIVDGMQAHLARKQARLGPLDQLKGEELTRLHNLLGSDLVVSGSFISQVGDRSNGRLQFEVKLQDTGEGTTVVAINEEGDAARLQTVIRRVGEGLRDALGVGATENELSSLLPSDPEANRLYALALDDRREFRRERARDHLQEAVTIEPDNPLLRSTLAEAWQDLGFSTLAVEEMSRAFELSEQLPERDRLSMEARYRTLSGDWPAARAIYDRLWDTFPDNLDYGLGGVEARIGAGAVDEALAQLDELRRLPETLSSDPRIDLMEARAAARGERSQLQSEAAERAATAARRLGADLFVARAQLTASEAQRRLGRPGDAVRTARSAYQVFEELGHREGQAAAALCVAHAEIELGDPEKAREAYDDALRLYRAMGDRSGTAASLAFLADLLEQQGDLGTAQETLKLKTAIHRELNDQQGLADTLSALIVVLIQRDRLGEAVALLEPTLTSTSDSSQDPAALERAALMAVLRGDLRTAQEQRSQALRLQAESGLAKDQLTSLVGLAALSLDLGEIRQADSQLTQAEALADQVGDPAIDADLLYQRGRLTTLRGELEAAGVTHESALDQHQDQGREAAALASRLALVRLDLDSGLPARAELLAREVREDALAEGRRAETAQATAFLIEALMGDHRLEEAQRVSDEVGSWDDVERIGVRIELDLARVRLEAATLPDPASPSEIGDVLDAFDALALRSAEFGLRPLTMRIRLQQADFAIRRPTKRRGEVLGRLRVLETEARAAGLLFFAEQAEAILGTGRAPAG
ncbi:MAG: protein kinase [Thermoanaerobaculia bacterium]|nr:protein kinase [Thermoanaerobaculia bacterium]